MVTKHYPLNGHESKETLGGSEGQGSLVCCSPWGHKESDMTQQLNNNKYSPWGCKESDTTERLSLSVSMGNQPMEIM